ncbi:MAG: gamma-glutamyltransferase [Symbiobacteriia bacterium]
MSAAAFADDFNYITAPFPGRSAYARGGMVASGHPLATAAGLSILAAGGNAVDAALAVAGATGVVMPDMSGLGGDAFLLYYDAASRTVLGMNGSGTAPYAATVDAYRARGFTEQMPLDGWLSVAVPGAVGVYLEAHRRWGSLPLSRLWAPAIAYARQGFPIDPRLAASITQFAGKLQRHPRTAEIYLQHGPSPRPGQILRNENLARSFEQVVAEGAAGYYRGSLGAAIVAASQAEDGLFAPQEFAEYRPDVYEPLQVSYRGYSVHQTAPPSQGLIMLEELNLLEGFDFSGKSLTDPDIIHLMVESKKLAFADRLAYLGDPRFVRAPLAELLSKEYAGRRRQQLNLARAEENALAGETGGDTTSFVVVDGAGNAVSFIHSNSSAWGSGVVAGSTGILLNNRAGRGFTLAAGHPNQLAPGKRTMHTLNTYLVTRGDEFVLVGNTPGGDSQPQWNLQVLCGVLDFGLNPYEAVAAPRWTSFPGTDPANAGLPLELRLESRFPAAAWTQLQEKGHRLVDCGPWGAGGSAQVIRRVEGGVLEGASDPRGGGLTAGL